VIVVRPPSDCPRLRFDVFIHWLCARYKLFLRLRLRSDSGWHALLWLAFVQLWARCEGPTVGPSLTRILPSRRRIQNRLKAAKKLTKIDRIRCGQYCFVRQLPMRQNVSSCSLYKWCTVMIRCNIINVAVIELFLYLQFAGLVIGVWLWYIQARLRQHSVSVWSSQAARSAQEIHRADDAAATCRSWYVLSDYRALRR